MEILYLRNENCERCYWFCQTAPWDAGDEYGTGGAMDCILGGCNGDKFEEDSRSTAISNI